MNVTIGNTLIKLRKSHHFTQQEVADHLHVSRQTYSGWENDQCDLTLSKFFDLADAYDIDVIDLLKVIIADNRIILT
jgi:transcriptional regulator with XRE-family HTH domain